jgi:hypothetical protein
MITFCVGGAVIGLLATRGLARRLFGPPPGHNDIVSYYMGAFGVFYGLTLGLIAVATWQNYTEVNNLVAEEAAALRVVHANASGYPRAVWLELNKGLLDYIDWVINDEWPAQQQGIRLGTSQQELYAIRRPLMAFDPETEGEKALHEETLQTYDRYLELRGTRISRGGAGVPSMVWVVLVVGAVLSIVITYCFSMESLWGHVVLTAVLSGFLGLLIFLILMMDYPFRGEFAVGPDAFVLARQRMQAYVALVSD